MVDFDRMDAVCVATFGETATYTPAGGGAPVGLSVIYKREYLVQDEVQGYVTTASLQASLADLLGVTRGDALTVHGKTYTIQEDPHRDDGGLAVLVLEVT